MLYLVEGVLSSGCCVYVAFGCRYSLCSPGNKYTTHLISLGKLWKCKLTKEFAVFVSTLIRWPRYFTVTTKIVSL